MDELRDIVRREHGLRVNGLRVSRASMCRMRCEAAVPLVKRWPSEDPLSLAGRTHSAVRDTRDDERPRDARARWVTSAVGCWAGDSTPGIRHTDNALNPGGERDERPSDLLYS
jgi:hypothetical protein